MRNSKCPHWHHSFTSHIYNTQCSNSAMNENRVTSPTTIYYYVCVFSPFFPPAFFLLHVSIFSSHNRIFITQFPIFFKCDSPSYIYWLWITQKDHTSSSKNGPHSNKIKVHAHTHKKACSIKSMPCLHKIIAHQTNIDHWKFYDYGLFFMSSI